MIQQKNNVSKGSGKLYIANLMLTIILAYCAWYELFMRYNMTNTGLQYKIVKLGPQETDTQDAEEKPYFTIERSISYGGKVIERPNQYGLIPFIYESKHHISHSKFNGKYEEALSMLKNKGDEIKIKIKAGDIPYEYGKPQLEVKAWRYVTVNLKLIDRFAKTALREVFEKYREERTKEVNDRINVELKNIEAYIQQKKYPAPIKKDNFYIVETEAGDGEKIKVGDEVEINYYFQRHNGKVLQTSIEDLAKKNKIKKDDTFKMQIPEHNTNWLSDCLVHFSNHSKGYVFFPSVDVFNIDLSKSFNIFYLDVVGVTKKEELEKNAKIKEQQSKHKDNKDKDHDKHSHRSGESTHVKAASENLKNT